MSKRKPSTSPPAIAQVSNNESLVRLDMNHAVFQAQLFELEKPTRHAALDTLKKLRQMTWAQVYQDAGLKWEKIRSQTSSANSHGQVHYSLRITQSRRAVAWRDGDYLRFLDIPLDHDATYGKK